jgi:hypothetical protein
MGSDGAKQNLTAAESKWSTTNKVARAIADAEVSDREKKTARLRDIRLQKEQADAAAAPAAPAKKARKPAARAAAKAKPAAARAAGRDKP